MKKFLIFTLLFSVFVGLAFSPQREPVMTFDSPPYISSSVSEATAQTTSSISQDTVGASSSIQAVSNNVNQNSQDMTHIETQPASQELKTASTQTQNTGPAFISKSAPMPVGAAPNDSILSVPMQPTNTIIPQPTQTPFAAPGSQGTFTSNADPNLATTTSSKGTTTITPSYNEYQANFNNSQTSKTNMNTNN